MKLPCTKCGGSGEGVKGGKHCCIKCGGTGQMEVHSPLSSLAAFAESLDPRPNPPPKWDLVEPAHDHCVEKMGELFYLRDMAVGTRVLVERIGVFILTKQPASNPVNWKNVRDMSQSASATKEYVDFTVTWLMGDLSKNYITQPDGKIVEGWQRGLPLAADERTILQVTATSIEEALEWAYAVGNRAATTSGKNGKEWLSEVRSVSVGDVALIEHSSMMRQVRAYYAVRGVGFERLNPEHVTISIAEDALLKIGAAAR